MPLAWKHFWVGDGDIDITFKIVYFSKSIPDTFAEFGELAIIGAWGWIGKIARTHGEPKIQLLKYIF